MDLKKEKSLGGLSMQEKGRKREQVGDEAWVRRGSERM
jgi:hypothetical protein